MSFGTYTNMLGVHMVLDGSVYDCTFVPCGVFGPQHFSFCSNAKYWLSDFPGLVRACFGAAGTGSILAVVQYSVLLGYCSSQSSEHNRHAGTATTGNRQKPKRTFCEPTPPQYLPECCTASPRKVSSLPNTFRSTAFSETKTSTAPILRNSTKSRA